MQLDSSVVDMSGVVGLLHAGDATAASNTAPTQGMTRCHDAKSWQSPGCCPHGLIKDGLQRELGGCCLLLVSFAVHHKPPTPASSAACGAAPSPARASCPSKSLSPPKSCCCTAWPLLPLDRLFEPPFAAAASSISSWCSCSPIPASAAAPSPSRFARLPSQSIIMSAALSCSALT